MSLGISKELLESVLQHSGGSVALPLSSTYSGLPRIESVCKMCLTLLLPVLDEIVLSQARQGTKIRYPGQMIFFESLIGVLFLPAILH